MMITLYGIESDKESEKEESEKSEHAEELPLQNVDSEGGELLQFVQGRFSGI